VLLIDRRHVERVDLRGVVEASAQYELQYIGLAPRYCQETNTYAELAVTIDGQIDQPVQDRLVEQVAGHLNCDARPHVALRGRQRGVDGRGRRNRLKLLQCLGDV